MKNGFTLVEALAVIGISGFTASLALNVLSDNKQQEDIEILSNDIADVIGGVDKRLANDKFDLIKWQQFENSGQYIFNNRQQVAEFLGKAIVAKSADGCGQVDGWNPLKGNETEEAYKNKYRFIDCRLWESKIPFDLNAKAEILHDSGQVTGFNLDLFFNNDEDFVENFISLKNSLAKAREKDEPNKSGVHQYQFVKDSDGSSLTTQECIESKTDCILRASFVGSANAYEYLYTNGSNNMVASKVKFQEDGATEAIKTCHRYTENAGNWVKTDSVYCGVGFGFSDPTDLNSAKLNYVEMATHSISSERIFLNKKCTFKIEGSDQDVPCGIFNTDMTPSDGVANKEIVAVYDELHVGEALIDVVETVDLKAENVVTKNLIADNAIINNQLTVNGAATFNDSVTIDGDPGDVNLVVNTSAKMTDVEANNLNVKGDALIDGSVEINGNLEIDDKLTVNTMQIGHTIYESDLGHSCDEDGLLAYFDAAEYSDLALCANGDWKLVNTQKNQIVAFNGDCPAGFEEFEDADGRTLVGQGSLYDDDSQSTITYTQGDIGGKSFHILKEDEMPEHDHGFSDAYFSEQGGNEGANLPGSNGGMDYGNNLYTRTIRTDAVGGGQAHENRMPYYVVNWCIYTK